MVASRYADFLIYMTAPLLGGVAGAFLFSLTFLNQDRLLGIDVRQRNKDEALEARFLAERRSRRRLHQGAPVL